MEDFMKLNKLLILSLLLLIAASGCTKNEKNNAGNNISSSDADKEPYGKYSANGKIVKIDKEGFHIQSGENVDVYKIDTGKTSNFYIGEYVRLNSVEGNLYDVVLDEEYDYAGITENLFDEASKLNVKVVEISRDESGAMRIYGLASDNKEYDIVAGADTATNFAHSTLKTDDEIYVYPENVSGDVPAVVEAKAIVIRNTD
jgi:hypothetical protein